MLSICLNGCGGHMGRVVTETVRLAADMQIVCGVDPFCDGTGLSYPVFPSVDAVSVPYDVIIDFSTASAVEALLRAAGKASRPVVLCTTGLSDEQKALIEEFSLRIPIFFSANMSIGVNLLQALAERASRILSPAGFDIEIEERHHRRKLDAPSGTALMLGEAVCQALGDGHYIDTGRMDRREARDPKAIGISALRGGTIVGEHTVVFAGQDEVIELKHTAMSRGIFAAGAVNAARFIAEKAPGLYDMRDLLNNT